MDSSELLGVVEILREAIKLLPVNGKIMAFLTLLYLAFTSTFLFIFSFSAKSLLHDLIVKDSFFPISISKSSDLITLFATIQNDMGFFLIIYLLVLFAYYFISLVSTISTISLSALSYNEKTISVTNLLTRVLNSWKRPLITGFYLTILELGYFCLFVVITSPVLFYSSRSFSFVVVIAMIAYLCYLYSSVVWVLAIIVSVMEEDCSGTEALGKAGRIVKGKRLQGFVLNVVFNIFAMIVFQGFRIISGYKWLVNSTAIAFVVMSISCLLKIFQLVAFTVFYFHCKKNHGEEIELRDGIESMEYSKISAALLGRNEALP